MKKNKSNQSNGHGSLARSIQLEFTHPSAGVVSVAGTFNDWHPGKTPMVALGEGRWIKPLSLPPGTYEYLFVADHEWMLDPLAKQTFPNPYGGLNSVLIV